LFDFKRTDMLHVLDEQQVGYFLALDEGQFVLIRIEGTKELAEKVKTSIERVGSGLFSHITIETWSPVRDAHDRIIGARGRAGLPQKEAGWKVVGMHVEGGTLKWQFGDEDLGKQELAFASFMSHVAGQFTRAYLEEMPFRVDDRWMMSVFIHLMLDSISTWHDEENESRQFPYI
jgi:hypothetical protein